MTEPVPPIYTYGVTPDAIFIYNHGRLVAEFPRARYLRLAYQLLEALDRAA